MKSLLSLLCLTVLGGASVMATPFSLQNGKLQKKSHRVVEGAQCMVNNKAASNAVLRKAPSKASELKMDWGYSDTPWNAYPMGYSGVIKQAIMMTGELATKFAGAEVLSVQIANPTDYNYGNPLEGQEFTVWISKSLDGEPVCSSTGVFGSEGFEYVSATLESPYTIEADTPIYIGCTFENPDPANYEDGLFTLMTDGLYPENEHTAYLYSPFEGVDSQGYLQFGDKYEWKAVGDIFSNICISATITGDMLPQNAVDLYEYLIPSVVKPNIDSDFVFIALNKGANDVSDLDFTFKVEGQEPQVSHVALEDGPLAYNEYGLAMVSFSCSKIGKDIPYEIQLSAVNGIPVEDGYKISGNLLCIEEGFDRNVVFEEATGTWCGWCVVGYAGMEYMKKEYSDKGFIGIAMHEGDDMAVLDPGQAYSSFLDYISGFPSSFMDRNFGSDIYPSPDDLESEFLDMVSNPSFVKIEADIIAEESQKDIKLVTKSTFSLEDDDADYGIAYTVVEDGVGPYPQHNYASGTGEDYYGFEDEKSIVLLTFNDVARNCSHPLPFDDSLPSKIEANTTYEYAMDISLSDVSDLSKYRVVAMVIDRKTGRIQNACEVSPDKGSGVNAFDEARSSFRVIGGKGVIGISNEIKANIFTSNGSIVAKGVNGNIQLPAGMYIVTSDNKSAKVIVR